MSHPWRALASLSAVLALLLACASKPLPAFDEADPSAIPQAEAPLPLSPDSVTVMAHRGFRAIAPENTLVSAQKAFDAGAQWWELDVAATRDDVLVVIHDDSLERTTDVKLLYPNAQPWRVYDFYLSELSTLDAGSWYAATDPFKEIASARVSQAELESFKGLGIPSLKDCLALTKAAGRKVNVEIKDATGFRCDAWIVERTVALIRDMGMLDSVVVSSFNFDYLARAKRAEPRLKTEAIVKKPPKADLVALLKGLGVGAYNPSIQYLDEATVRQVRAVGIEVNAWTVNETSDMRRILAWGATGIITDYPDRALELLAQVGGSGQTVRK